MLSILLVFQFLFALSLCQLQSIYGEPRAGFTSKTFRPILIFPVPPAPTISPTIKSDNCTQFSNGTHYWFTFRGTQPNDPLSNGINSCYYLPDNYHLVSWHEARDYCLSQGASLASIHNYTINYLLSHRINFGRDNYTTIYWIGLNSLTKRGVYKWFDNTPTDWSNFSDKTSTGDLVPPNVLDQGRCVSFRSLVANGFYKRVDQGQWFRDDCNGNHKFICEKKIDNSVPPTVPPPQGNCPKDWYQFPNYKCVKYINTSMTFNDSRAECIGMEAELLSIHSDEEQDFIVALTAGQPTPYIGLRRSSYYYSYSWDNQDKIDFTNFGIQNNYPGANYLKFCVVVVTNATQPGKWLQVNCTDKYPVLCEKPLDPAITSPGMTFSDQKCKIAGFEDYVQYQNSCYSLFDSDPNKFVSFQDAETACQQNGTHLLSIVNPFEQAFLRYYIKQNGKSDMYWIGLQSKIKGEVNVSQVFEWTDDWPVYYTNWDKYEPQNAGLPEEECVSMAKNSSLWKTSMCVNNYAFICKKSTDELPIMNSNKTGVCPKINDTDYTLAWIDIDRRSPYCYWFSVDRKGGMYTGLHSWDDASFHCRKRNGTLASIHSKHELMLMKNKLTTPNGKYYNTWIGLSKDPNGEFVWEDGTPLDFFNWDPYEKIVSRTTDLNDDSDHQCVEVKSTDQMWKQQPCSGNKRNFFVCAVKKVYSNINDTDKGEDKDKDKDKDKGEGKGEGKGLSGGAKAGIAFAVIIGVLVVAIIGFKAFKTYRPNSTIVTSFENRLYASKRGTGKPNTEVSFERDE